MPHQPYHRDDLRAQLIAATTDQVERDGAQSVTIAKIAKACSVSVAAPYRHFDGKDELLGAVAGDGFIRLGAALAAAAAQDSTPRDRLLAAGVAYVEFAAAHPHLFTLMFDRAQRTFDPAAPRTLQGLGDLVAAVRPRAPIDVAVRSTWALAHGLALLRLGDMLSFTDGDSRDRLRAELAVALDGILG